ncbi:MAG TPA: DUF1998 domain-containing protein, partial [Rhodocyclaceae bacterium]|nr:DUF1998 domain-containing protein [Rhodocyclaceae bacterium]
GTWSAVTGPDGRGSLRGLAGQDLGQALTAPRFRPTVFLYDNQPGGIGLAAPLYDLRQELLERSLALVRDCACREGCPACVGPVLPPPARAGMSARDSAIAVLESMRDAQ